MSIEVGLTEVGWAKIGEPRRSLGAFRRWGPNAGDIEAIDRREPAGALFSGRGYQTQGAALKTSLRPLLLPVALP
jgi:hypothetical protein